MRRFDGMVKNVAASFLLGGLALFVPTASHAAPVYCAAQPAGGLDESNVTFRGLNSDDCYGVVTNPGNPTASGLPSTWTVNTLASGLFGGGWDGTVKDDGAVGTTSYLGINWTLNAPQQQSSGNWTLTLADPGPVNLPLTIDMMVILKASNKWAAYLFTAETFALAGANAGTFQIAFLNGGNNTPGLSNMQLYFRPAPTQVSEPGTLAIVGLGLIGATFGRRRMLRANQRRTV